MDIQNNPKVKIGSMCQDCHHVWTEGGDDGCPQCGSWVIQGCIAQDNRTEAERAANRTELQNEIALRQEEREARIWGQGAIAKEQGK